MTARGALLMIVLGGCASEVGDERSRYLNEAGFRRDVLEASLVRDDNGYARLRLDAYGLGDEGWDALPAWDPPVRPATLDDLGRFVTDRDGESEGPFEPLLRGDPPRTDAELLELGRRAFERYPVQLTPSVGRALDDDARLEQSGLWVDEREHVGGLVRVRVADGTERFAVTCATCHARSDGGALVHGAASPTFDWGVVAHRAAVEAGRPPEAIEDLLGWGPGRIDVTPDGAQNPAAIADLRATRHQPYLHWAGTLHNSRLALAIRLETLLITSMREALRPPRLVAYALARYVWSLGEDGAAGDVREHPMGAASFARHCASCHGADGSTPRDRVPLETIGTDRAVGDSTTRGTGFYRVPSLWRVGERTRLLHDGSVATVAELLDGSRLDSAPGHEYGLGLSAVERDALAAFVSTIGR